MFEMIGNTALFNGSLPRTNAPGKLQQGSPIFMMLIGPQYGELKI